MCPCQREEVPCPTRTSRHCCGSRSTGSEDLIRKSVEYQQAGIGQYWVLDPELRTIEVMVNAGDHWRTTLLLDDDHPTGSAELDGVTLALDLREVLRN